MIHSNRLAQSLNVLSCKPVTIQPNIRQTKAQKYFQKTAVLPKSLKDDLMLSTNNPEINGRPSKPVSVEVEVPDENDPFYQIERVTNKIGRLVTNYEEQAEQEHYTMLQELDSNFQINNYDTKEILDESRKAVDDLMNKAKILKETQAGMLDDLSDWFSREEKSLKDADLNSNINFDTSMPVTTDDLLQVLQSSAGTSHERVTKAIALHGDIVSHAFFAIHELKRKNHDQQVLITDLQHQLSEISSRRIQRQQSEIRPESTETQRKLQEALSRLDVQKETIKRLNERIEQLVGESVLKGRFDESNEKDETSALLRVHDVLELEGKIDKQTHEIINLTDQVLKLKHDLHSTEAEKSFLESEISSYKEKIDLEQTRYESLHRQMLEIVNQQQDSKDQNKDEKKREKSLMAKIDELQNEVQNLNDKMLNDKKVAYQEAEKIVKELRKEFETREIELKKRQLNEVLDSNQQSYFEAIQSQHADEMNLMKKNCNETIENLKKKFAEDKELMEKEFTEKIKSFQKELQNVTSVDISKLIDSLQKRSDEKIIEMKQSYAEKLDEQRNDFQKHIKSLEDEIKKKDVEIMSLTSELEEIKSSSQISDQLSSEDLLNESQSIIKQLKNTIADYEIKFKELSENFESEKESEIESIKSEFLEKINKANEVDEMNKKLRIELKLLKEQIKKGVSNDSFVELTNSFAQQTAELNEANAKLNELKEKLDVSENKIHELIKENQEIKNGLYHSRKIKLLDYVYREQFSLSKPIEKKNQSDVAYEHQSLLMQYDVIATIVPRNKTKKQPKIDNKSLLINEIKLLPLTSSKNKLNTSNLNHFEIKEETRMNEEETKKNEEETKKNEEETKKNEEETKKNEEETKKNEEETRKNEEETKKNEEEKIIYSLNSYDIFSHPSRSPAKLSLAHPLQLLIRPMMDGKPINMSELQSSREVEFPPQSAARVVQLGLHSCGSFFIDSSAFCSLMSVAVQVEVDKKREIVSKPLLSHQPPLEVFTITESAVRPEEPIVLEPSPVVFEDLRSPKGGDEGKVVLVTESGDLIDVPSIEEVDSTTRIEAANEVSRMVIEEASGLSKRLRLVVSEIQSIEEEQDPVKRVQMQETLGVQLDVEKDSLISQMRERITELEQMMNRVAEVKNEEQPSTAEVHSKVEQATNSTQTDLKPLTAENHSKIEQATNSTQTDLKPLTAENHSKIEQATNSTQTELKPLTAENHSKIEQSVTVEFNSEVERSTNSTQTDFEPSTANNDSKVERSLNSAQFEEKPITAAPLESAILCASSVQTDLVQFENVGTTPTDISTPEDLPKKPPRDSVETASALSIEGPRCDVDLGISSPSQSLDVALDIPRATVDLSAEFGVQYFQITPYSQRSRSSDGYDKPPIVLEISSSVESSYNRQQPPALSVASQNLVELADQITTQRGTSPLLPQLVDVATSNSTEPVHEGRQIVVDQSGGAKGSRSFKINLNNIKTISHHISSSTIENEPQKPFTLVTKSVLNVSPVSLKGDVNVAHIQQQAEQISDLKKHILRLQFTSSENLPRAISNVDSAMSLIADNINAMQSKSTEVFVRAKVPVKTNDQNLNSTALLRESIESSESSAQTILNDKRVLLGAQNEVLSRISSAVASFIAEMTKPGGASDDAQSRFLRQINDASNELSGTVSALQTSLVNDDELAKEMRRTKEILSSEEEFVGRLQREIIDLKLGSGKSRLVQQLADVKDELQNVLEGRSDENKVIKNIDDAQLIIPKVALKGRNDSVARQAGATLVLERIANLSKRTEFTKSGNVNDWPSVVSLLGEAVSLLDEHDAKHRARRIIDELNLQIKMLQSDVTRLQTEAIVAGRDLQVAEDKYSAHVKSLQRSFNNANEHANMLERQLDALKKNQASNDKDMRVRNLENELEVMRKHEKKLQEENSEATRKCGELICENKTLTEEITSIKEKYAALFNQCTDTQTTNEALKSKTEEIFMEAEIAKQKADALDKIRQKASMQADDLAQQLSSLLTENSDLQKMLNKVEQKLREVENELFEEKNKKKFSTTSNSASNFEKNFSVNEVQGTENSTARVIKVYQQRIEDYMSILARNGSDLVDLRARHATDQKSIIMIQREMRRNQNDYKINQLRYDCAKKENSLLSKAIANRDETIRMLKREIERLRSLLKVQGPLKQKIQLFEKEKNSTEAAYLRTQDEVQKTIRQRDQISTQNPQITSYFDGLLQRQRETLARLEKRRNELREIDEKNKLETLRAVSQVVNMAELQIPEEVIFRLMPKPSPVQRLQQQQQQQLLKQRSIAEQEEKASRTRRSQQQQQQMLQSQRARQASYADTLQMIGQLAGQKSPRTLHEMLRNSMHNRVVLPVQPAPLRKKGDAGSVLAIRPMRK